MSRQTSIQLSDATRRQVADLTAAGHGNLTAIVRTAIDRMHAQECGHRQRQDGQRQAEEQEAQP